VWSCDLFGFNSRSCAESSGHCPQCTDLHHWTVIGFTIPSAACGFFDSLSGTKHIMT
jgi:hypothetical protein